MKLRARSSNGQKTLGEALGSNSTVKDLFDDVKLKFGYHAVKIKVGFPPKQLELSDQLLSSVGLKDGDVLNVEGAATAAGPSTATAQVAVGPALPVQSTASLETGFGKVVARNMKDDNSCLFRSIAFLFLRNAEECGELRKVVKAEIEQDPFNYNEAILGKEVDAYCDWILKPNSWGGAIELAIFAKYFQTTIVSLDVSSGRLDRFGYQQYPQSTAFVIYSGIHYDAVAVSPSSSDTPDEFDVVVFPPNEALVVEDKLKVLGDQWRKQRKFTDLAAFTLKCGICSVGLKGQKEAQDHAMKTGHQSFTEY